MRASLGDESAPLWQEPVSPSISLTTLHKGDEFEIGKVIRKKKEVWVTITLDSGVTGYITGDTHIFAVTRVEATGNDLEVHEAPNAESHVLKVIPKKTFFTVHSVEKTDEETWYRIEDEEGVKGYVKSGARMRALPQVTKSSARRQMITGAIFAVAGVIIYFAFPPASGASSSSNFITLAIILLGLFQLFQGFMQYRQAKK